MFLLRRKSFDQAIRLLNLPDLKMSSRSLRSLLYKRGTMVASQESSRNREVYLERDNSSDVAILFSSLPDLSLMLEPARVAKSCRFVAFERRYWE
jgi:hypothetical protein